MAQLPSNAPVRRYFRPGESLFREKEASRSVFLIKKGTVSIRKSKKGGHLEIARIYANEMIGELSFFDRQPTSAAAVALTEVEAFEISFESLERIFAGVPDYFKTIVASLANRLRRANEQIRRFNNEVVPEAAGAGLGGLTATEALAAVEETEGVASETEPDETGVVEEGEERGEDLATGGEDQGEGDGSSPP